ncbi:suppressor of hpr1 [Coemansia biformis]|uniref:Mediator of RNA polymerase II transcription subunit 31 n=1 Tax=Coemansia biformis TaxID=1286918 RepID=A0A9W7XSC2_9FUNG|nr:suppressor of hpr1 [Coemansia biformis]
MAEISAASGPSTSGEAHDAFMKVRFEVELEFLQCLANPVYARFVVYPHALAFLDLLQHKSFRDEMKRIDEATRVHELQYHHWRWPNHETAAGDGDAEADAAEPVDTLQPAT